MQYNTEERLKMIEYLKGKIAENLLCLEISDVERKKKAILNIKLNFLLNWLCFGIFPSESIETSCSFYYEADFIKYSIRHGVEFSQGSIEKEMEDQMVKEAINNTNEELRRCR